MHQVQAGPRVTKVLHKFPEIVELTETRKRAIAGGRADIETALKSMVSAANQPYNNVEPNTTNTVSNQKMSTKQEVTVTSDQRALINQARSAAQAAQSQTVGNRPQFPEQQI